MKKSLALLLALVMTLALVACGGGNNKAPANNAPANNAPADNTPADPAPAEPSGDKIDISVIAAQYGQNTAKWWADFQDEFNKTYENINLNVEVVSWNDIYTVVNTRISGDAAPDILNIDVFADYQADDLLLPAKDYVSEETYAKFYDAFLEQSNIDGTIWAVPDLASARALYYNADILEAAGVEVPTTWDELTAACEKLKAYDSNIYPWGIDMTTDEGQAAFAYYIWNNGGDFTDADGNWTLNSPENVEAVEYAVGLVNAGLTNSDPANETRYTLQDLFGAGQLAMMIGPNSIPTYIAVDKEPDEVINYGTAPIPTNEGKPSVSAGVMDRFMCFDNGHSDEKLEAIKTFFDFFYEDERYSDWVLMEDFLPATKTGGEIAAAADERMASWVEIVGSCKFYPTAQAKWADVKQGVIDVQQQALLGGNVQELLDNLQADIVAG
ncbi:MAG: extracellular solute-binding protein [Oscillospiraceae bacterium]|nr:extracellular solute-binding protein [Oscillospiraceae bacterium]MCI9317240.1 extracellular solute-binding protein [Oscillospiraceae bacterium]